MKKSTILFLLSQLIFLSPLLSQTTDAQKQKSKEKNSFFHSRYVKESIAPLSLATAGAIVLSVPNLKENLQERLNWNKDDSPNYKNMGDDYIRYAPPILTYLLSDLLHDYGFEAKHRFIDRTAILAASYIVSDLIVYRTKKLTRSPRPLRAGTRTPDSFPSQHTAMAFVGATFLHRELGHISPWISVGGYAVASYVGYARIARNRHWTSDVLVGAAVGIAVTNASYWAYDAIMSRLSSDYRNNLVITPFIDFDNNAGIAMAYTF